MSKPKVEAIRDDLICPGCHYSLRGLAGDRVDCPECGYACDMTALVAARWTAPWHKDPGLNHLAFPAGVAFAGTLCVFYPVLRWFFDGVTFGGTKLAIAASLVFLFWGFLLWRTRRYFDSPWEGPALALLTHALLVEYLGGIVGFCITLVMIVSLFVEGIEWVEAWYVVMPLVVSVVLFFASQWGEKFTAHRCIGQYLRNQSRIAAPWEG